MNQQIRNQNESTEKCILESSHSENVSKPVVKEALKSIKVYIPSDNYDSQLSFEQNLAQGGVKLFNEIPASDIGIDTPFSDCMTVPLIRSKQSELNASGKEQNASKPTSPSDFDSLIDPSLQRDSSYENEKPHSYSGSSFDYSQQNISSPESEKYHSCDVCLQGFARRRDLALHYLTHTDKEKRRAAKKIKKCDICGNKQCNCKSFFEKMYPNYSNMPTSLSVAQPENTSTIFIQAESMSGNTSLIKRDLFHCPDCDQKFGLESQLKQHSLVHKRERAKKEQSFSCNLCTQKFSDQNALTYHISTVHPSNSLYTV